MASMKYLLAIIGAVTVLSIACASVSNSLPATPTGGGAMPTATLPAAAGGAPTTSGPPTAEQGKTLVSAKGCIACHTIAGTSTSTIGPCLSDVGDSAKHAKIAGGALDNNEANKKRWLANPPAVKPGTLMPNLNLSTGEIDSLIAYLDTLKGSC